MKRLLAVALIAVLNVLTIGCDSQQGTTENKTVTTTSQTKNSKTVGETRSTDTRRKVYVLLWGSGLSTVEAPVPDTPAADARVASEGPQPFNQGNRHTDPPLATQ